jgi:hypothetical protein
VSRGIPFVIFGLETLSATRIKSITEKHERVARESDLTLSVSVFA